MSSSGDAVLVGREFLANLLCLPPNEASECTSLFLRKLSQEPEHSQLFGDSGNGIRNTEKPCDDLASLDASCDRVRCVFWGLLSKMVFNAFLSQISDFISWACLSS